MVYLQNVTDPEMTELTFRDYPEAMFNNIKLQDCISLRKLHPCGWAQVNPQRKNAIIPKKDLNDPFPLKLLGVEAFASISWC